MESIQNRSAIWDMHIHTCDCPKGSNEFVKMNREKYIERIIEIFESNSDLELFSFTDHNQISIEVYREYIKQNGKTNFLVGVEQDVIFDSKDDPDAKHLLIYFDIEKYNFENQIDFMNDYNNFVKKGTVTVHDLLSYLIEKSIKFVLSPHAFKQGKRGIENKWTTEEITVDKAHKYTGQFFCFWEAQGYSQIAKAEEFLENFNLNNKISIISFSDSNNFTKLINYINEPTQYFISLPNFKGLELVASENRRILSERYEVASGNYGNLIGKVTFDENDIFFSNKLNCIIGGRGSGKSILLDSIANRLTNVNLRPEREKYINTFPVEIYNYSNNPIEKHNFQFDYFKQSYVADLFDNNDYYNKIRHQFEDELKDIEDIDVNKIKDDNYNLFSSNLINYETCEHLENISDFINKYIIISDNAFKNSYAKKDKGKNKTISYGSYDSLSEKMIKLIPKQLQDDDDIKNSVSNLLSVVAKKTHEYNLKVINHDVIKNLMIDEYFRYKNNHSDLNKEKAEVENLLIQTFKRKSYVYSKRVNIINSYIKAQKEFVNYYENYVDIDGEKNKAFRIKKLLKIETPFEYLIKLFNEYFYKNNLKNNVSDKYIDLEVAIKYYCYEKNKSLKDGKSLEELDKELMSFNLNYDYHPQILYMINGEYQDLLNLSPGTQTNILMEYLVYKDTDRPILIDQPEDNVDNQTIYNKLTTWFGDLKLKRQVIVVTHDANIVINADAENVIIANHDKKDSFDYTFGALEFGDNLERASKILDGGKEAVKRRLMKYGE